MGMRRMAALLAACVLLQSPALLVQSRGPQDLPPLRPREGATEVFDNRWGTAWDVTWPPNVPTAVHRHAYDYVGVELVDSTFTLTAPRGQPRTSSLKKGTGYFLPKGTTHVEEGLSSDPPRRAILIDLKDEPSPFQENTTRHPTAFPADVARRIADNPRVVMWDITWTPGQIAPMYFHRRNFFIVFVDGGELAVLTQDGQTQAVSASAGQVLFTAGGRALAHQATTRPVRAVVVELK